MRALHLTLIASLLAGCGDAGPAEVAPAAAPSQVQLDPERVPAELRDLIPYAAQWGIGDDVLRGEYEASAPEAEKQRFQAALRGRTAAVQAWLDSLSPDEMGASEEAGAYLFMLEALDEMGLWPD